MPLPFDHDLRTRKLGTGVYLVAWPPGADDVSGGDAIVVEANRAAPAWLDVADIAIQHETDLGVAPVDAGYPQARNALIVVRRLDGEWWLLRPQGTPACFEPQVVRGYGLLLGVLAYRWLVGGSGAFTAKREMRRGPA